MPTQQHPFRNHLFTYKYYTYKYLKPVSSHLQPTSKTSTQIPSTRQVTSSELQTVPSESDTLNLPPIQTYKYLMPHKAFKLLCSQNFTSRLPNHFKASSRKKKQQNQECFLSIKKFRISTYCNMKRLPIVQANKHQTKHNIHNLSNPRSFPYLLFSFQQPKTRLTPSFSKSIIQTSKHLSRNLNSITPVISIHKTSMTNPLNKQHSPHRTPNDKE